VTEDGPYDERDEESGEFQRKFADVDFINSLEQHQPATTNDIAEDVGCKYRTAYERLQQLEDGGKVEAQKVGSSLLWSLSKGE